MAHLQEHGLGSSDHSTATLAELNAKVSDATLDDSGDPRDPNTHAASHGLSGSDEISVAGLSGVLADEQNPTDHASNHTDGTDDIQLANGSQKGLLDYQAQTIGGQKTFDTAPRISPLNTGDNIITTDTDGDMQESGARVETAPTGGSGFTVVEYASAPTSPPAGFLWMQAKDGSTKTLCYYDGSNTYTVDLAV
jgi:hypothetical protein